MGWLASSKEFLKKLSGREDSPGSKWTPRAEQVLELAGKEAQRMRLKYIGTEHVLLGLMRLETGVAYNVLERLELNLEKVRKEVERQVGTGPDDQFASSLPYTPRVKKVVHFAREEARALHHTYIGTEHLLLGLLREGDGMAVPVLKHCGMDLERVRVEVLKELDPNYNSDDEFYTG